MPQHTHPRSPREEPQPPDPRCRLLRLLACPLCGAGLTPAGGALRCEARHSFDIARQGYVSLLTGGPRAGSADTAEMVAARDAFLRAGHYAPLVSELARTAAGVCPPDGTVLDAGTGTGHYLAAVLDALPGAVGLGLDVSKFALRRAARAHPRAGAASWDVWRPLPVRTGGADILLNVFAPRNGPEFHRVLSPGGALIVVTPTVRHLAGLREAAGLLSVDAEKDERLRRTLSAHFRRERETPLEYGLTLDAQDAGNAAAMGPSAHHLAPGEEDPRPAAPQDPGLAVTASFNVAVYRPR
jgi:23S rRNA (guanine745-N1)-methyltransferase